ncbi:MAG: hypothetical protein Q7S03_03190 [bacterium]|nr:hypothetical protein [bacterium]
MSWLVWSIGVIIFVVCLLLSFTYIDIRTLIQGALLAFFMMLVGERIIRASGEE